MIKNAMTRQGEATNARMLKFIHDYQATHFGRLPCYREIAAGSKLRSTNTVQYHLKQLAAAGRVNWTPKLARSAAVMPT